jgi:hypothetical protein
MGYRPRSAKPIVNQCRAVSPEIDALSRRLQAEIGCTANALAEMAIRALAEQQERRQSALAAE